MNKYTHAHICAHTNKYISTNTQLSLFLCKKHNETKVVDPMSVAAGRNDQEQAGGGSEKKKDRGEEK